MIRFAFLLVLVLIIDLYAWRGVKLLAGNIKIPALRKSVRVLFWSLTYFFVAYLFYTLSLFITKRSVINTQVFQYLLGLFVLIYVPKIIFISFLLGNDVWSGISKLIRRFRNLSGKHAELENASSIYNSAQKGEIEAGADINRKQFITRTGAIVASVPFFGILHGIVEGRYNYKLHRHTLTLSNLPEAFDGIRIAQISDIHSGSFDSVSGVQGGIDLLRAQEADLVFFTGDLVNNIAEEMDPWRKYFRQIEAPMGVHSVVGNHDYGIYYHWDSDRQRDENFAYLKEQHSLMGWNLLMNRNKIFTRKGEHLAVVGVQNWGKPPFPQYGDLDQALKGVPKKAGTILLSHDPTHWDAKVLLHKRKMDLTLSGHTHGMQFGVEVLGYKWSPVSMVYPRWAGIYQENGQYLNVNRGFGFIGFPGRVGIFPEISLITLKKGQA